MFSCVYSISGSSPINNTQASVIQGYNTSATGTPLLADGSVLFVIDQLDNLAKGHRKMCEALAIRCEYGLRVLASELRVLEVRLHAFAIHLRYVCTFASILGKSCE
jgi:hypothetical protein